jgi:DNA-binding transcriptional regulator YdaS (Cro superfamily)
MIVFLSSKKLLTIEASLWQSRGTMSKSPTRKAVDEAVRREGSLKIVARRLEITTQAISQWERVPSHHVLALEEMSGISRHELRPDVFGPPPKGGRVSRAA